MTWWGKLVGGAFGFVLGGPLGALVGAALGHNVDRGVERLRVGQGGPRLGGTERVQTAFFTATFSVMGHLAKADGRVSEREIALAQSVMAHMELAPDARKAAIRLFNEGKRPQFPLNDILDQFKQECRRSRHLIQMFIEIQLQAAYADGPLNDAERRLLSQICSRLGFSAMEYQLLEGMVRAQQQFAGGGRRQAGGATPRRDFLKDAYAVLGISSDVSDAEVKKAYRRLMNQHHPDKLVAKGLPEEMMKLAAEKTQEIRSAYERVREARGF